MAEGTLLARTKDKLADQLVTIVLLVLVGGGSSGAAWWKGRDVEDTMARHLTEELARAKAEHKATKAATQRLREEVQVMHAKLDLILDAGELRPRGLPTAAAFKPIGGEPPDELDP